MPLVTKQVGVGGAEARAAFDNAMESRRDAFRQRLIAARGSTYTYKDPDTVASRAGAKIGDDGRIVIGGSRPRGGAMPGTTSGSPRSGIFTRLRDFNKSQFGK